MYWIQNVYTGNTMNCPPKEAKFWASLSEDFYYSLHYNVYRQGGSMVLLSVVEIR